MASGISCGLHFAEPGSRVLQGLIVIGLGRPRGQCWDSICSHRFSMGISQVPQEAGQSPLEH